jgi:hypothetical protein
MILAWRGDGVSDGGHSADVMKRTDGVGQGWPEGRTLEIRGKAGPAPIVIASSELELKRSAVHEGGHAVLFVHFGLLFDFVTIRDDGGSDGSIQPIFTEQDKCSNARISQIAREQIIIAYAGAASQRMFYPNQREDEILACSMDDRENIRRIVNDPECGVNDTYPAQAETEAASLVRKLRGVIEAVADALLQKETLSYAEVKDVHMTHRRNHADC